MRRPLIAILVLALLPLGCGPKAPPPVASSADLKDWERPEFQAGGGDALMLFVVFGKFDGGLQLSRSRHRSGGLPEGVKISQFSRAKDAKVIEEFDQGYFGTLLEEQASLAAAVKAAPQCMLVRGTVRDPRDLIYLRETIGVVTAALDSGGVAVLDSQKLTWWTPAEWREKIFYPDKPSPRQQVVIFVSDEKDGPKASLWVHTRGLRKFGRPDLSIHRVTPEHKEAILDLCNRFIELQALGGRIPEGQPIKMSTLPKGMSCHHAGSLDDLEFNNVHVEIQWP